MTRRSMMGLVREGRRKVRGSGFLITWDSDSRDQATTNRVKYFVFGRAVRNGGKEYSYPGFVWSEGVRYLAQSALFVLPHRISEIRHFLERNGVDHEVEAAVIV